MPRLSRPLHLLPRLGLFCCWAAWFSWSVQVHAFPYLYTAKNFTDTLDGVYHGVNVSYLPVYTVGILNRVLQVLPMVGQFSAVIEVLMEWEDSTAYEAMVSSTEKYHNLTVATCQKPCTSGYVKDLCCDEVFSVNVEFANAASSPAITSNLWVGENGHVFQGMQITGTFYQDFKLKNYPYGSLEAAISLRLSQSLYNSQDAVTILPVPVAAKYLENNNGDSAGNGWYLSNVRLVGNRPDFVRDLRDFDLSDPITNASMMDWRGANMTEGRLRDGQFRLSSFLSLLDAFSPTLDFRFDLHVGSVDAFITTLPLALLALLNLSVFLTPLFDPRNRISYSISLFFTTTATLLTQNYGGTNELNAVQRLAVVIFAMLVFTVFSTIVWNGVFNYKEGKAEVINDWNLVTGKWRKTEMITPGVSARDLSPMMSPREDEKGDHGGVGNGDVAEGIEHGVMPIGKSMNKTIGRIPIIGTSLTGPRGRGPPSGPQPKTFRQRFRDDREFRSSFCRFADRCCLLTTFIVYTVCFIVICTESSESDLYGLLDTNSSFVDALATDTFNASMLGPLVAGWV